MFNQELRNKVDRLWDSFWTGGISNPLTIVEQISYLFFIKRLDEVEILQEKKANRLNRSYMSGFPANEYRWSTFKHLSAEQMYQVVMEKVFPFIKTMGKENSVFAQYMRDAVLMIQKPSLLHEAIQLIDGIRMDDADTKGDLYEYLLSKLATAGVNGQFRTPRHIIRMMVEMVDPAIEDRICDPACGTAGFLLGAYEYVLEKYTSPESVFVDEHGMVHNRIGDRLTPEERKHLNEDMFYGNDFDSSMLRISAMNMLLHGFDAPNIMYSDTLSAYYEVENAYTLILANPPFKGSLDEEDVHPSLRSVVNTRKTELLFVALFERILELGGRCAAIVPDGVLFGSTKGHKEIRQCIVEANQLEAVVSMPPGVFKPYAGVSTAILFFTKGGKTDQVWYYDMHADGYSLDDKRTPVQENDIPDIIAKWRECKADKFRKPAKDENWFWVKKEEIVGNGYDLSINRYKEIEYEEARYEKPEVIMERLMGLEQEILQGLTELKEMMRR